MLRVKQTNKVDMMKVFKNPNYKNDDCTVLEYIVSETGCDLSAFGEKYQHFVECEDKVSESRKLHRISTFCFYGSV